MIEQFLLNNGCDNIESAFRMEGVWKCQVRSARSILQVLVEQSATHLDDELLRTFQYISQHH